MPMLAHKVALVTGAAGGIGRPLCRLLAVHGCRLGLLGRHRERLEALAADLRQEGTLVCLQPVDLGQREQVTAAVALIERNLGAIDLLIHNAGLACITDAVALDVDAVARMLRVNYLGGVYAIEAVLPGMLARQQGHLVAVSSLGSRRGMPWSAGYSASKAALNVYLESLRPALRRRGIHVTTVFPGFVRTAMSQALPLHPWVPMLSAETAACHILRAVLKRRREVSFPWYAAALMGVLRRLPAWAFDCLMARHGRRVVLGDY